MYLYNITINTDQRFEKKLVEKIKNQFIPNILNTKLFKDYKLLKLLTEMEGNGCTFSLQLFFESPSQLEIFHENVADKVMNQLSQGNEYEVVFFTTLLEEV